MALENDLPALLTVGSLYDRSGSVVPLPSITYSYIDDALGLPTYFTTTDLSYPHRLNVALEQFDLVHNTFGGGGLDALDTSQAYFINGILSDSNNSSTNFRVSFA